MLVLSRHKDEIIAFRNKITLEEWWSIVCDIRGDKVRVGHSCPEHIEIHRLEVFKEKYGRLPQVATSEGLLTPKGIITP